MPTNEEVRAALRDVLDPEIGKPIEDVGMLKDIRIEGDTVTVTVLLTIEGCPLRERIETDVTAAVAPLPGVGHVQVVLGTMSEDQRGELVTKLRAAGPSSRSSSPTGRRPLSPLPRARAASASRASP